MAKERARSLDRGMRNEEPAVLLHSLLGFASSEP